MAVACAEACNTNDCVAVVGEDLDEKERAAGADGLFPEAMADADEFRRFAAAFADVRSQNGQPPILLANMTEFGKTTLLPLAELSAMGYRIVIYPQTALRVGFGAITKMLADLRRDGTQSAWLDRMQTRKELYDLLDYDGLEIIDRAAQEKGT